MQKTSSNQKKSSVLHKNPIETLSDLGTDTVKKAASTFGKMGSGMIDQLFGVNQEDDEDQSKLTPDFIKKETKKVQGKQEKRIFNYNEYFETTLIKKQIQELTKLIKREIEALKKANASLLAEVKDVEKITINDHSEKPGIYHVRFLEIVLNILRVLRAKVGESKTWLQALISKKKKRGSLFAVRSKKAGTQYSLSQELQTARSVQ